MKVGSWMAQGEVGAKKRLAGEGWQQSCGKLWDCGGQGAVCPVTGQ